MGLEMMPAGPDEFDRFIRAEIGKWAVRIKEAGIQPE
jgi:tripartite-type tricarboxylate transporter receptor subunit TctC